MKKADFRLNPVREHQRIEEAVDRLITPDSFVRDLPAQDMIEAFTRLFHGAFREYQDHLERREEPPESYPDPAELWKRAHHNGQCAWEHFRSHAQERLRLALVELMHESMGFAEAIYQERCGQDEEKVKESRPTLEDIQQNVLRHAVIRLHQLPLKREDNFWQGSDAGGENTPMAAHIARLILKDIPLWTYDHLAVTTSFQQLILPLVAKHEDPEGEARFWGIEAGELIWEHIDGATQIMMLILVEWALMLSKHSAAKRHEVELDPTEAKQIQPSKEKLKEIATTLIGLWMDQLPFDWRGRGRPVKTSTEKAAGRDALLTELRGIAGRIIAAGDQVTWEGLAARRRNRPSDKPQSGESLRKEADSLDLRLGDIKPEEN